MAPGSVSYLLRLGSRGDPRASSLPAAASAASLNVHGSGDKLRASGTSASSLLPPAALQSRGEAAFPGTPGPKGRWARLSARVRPSRGACAPGTAAGAALLQVPVRGVTAAAQTRLLTGARWAGRGDAPGRLSPCPGHGSIPGAAAPWPDRLTYPCSTNTTAAGQPPMLCIQAFLAQTEQKPRGVRPVDFLLGRR